MAPALPGLVNLAMESQCIFLTSRQGKILKVYCRAAVLPVHTGDAQISWVEPVGVSALPMPFSIFRSGLVP